jgi:hypothetical protein
MKHINAQLLEALERSKELEIFKVCLKDNGSWQWIERATHDLKCGQRQTLQRREDCYPSFHRSCILYRILEYS